MPEKMEVVFDDPLSCFTEKKITHMNDLLPLLEKIAQGGRLAVDWWRKMWKGTAGDSGRQQTARRALVRRGQRHPDSAIAARPCCRTWPILTGGQVISEELGLKLEKA